MSTPPTRHSMIEAQKEATERNAIKLNTLEVEVGGLKQDIGMVRGEIGGVKADMRAGFNELYAKMDRVLAPKSTPWGAVALITTIAISLAAWGNAWISQSITGVQQAAKQADMRAAAAELRAEVVHERMTVQHMKDAEARGSTTEWRRWMETCARVDKGKTLPTVPE